MTEKLQDNPSRRQLLPYFSLASLAMMSLGGVFPLLGELRDQLGFSETGLGFMVAMGFFTAFSAQIGLARFSDRGHSGLMIRLGLILVSTSMALMSIADELWQFVGCRMLLGLGTGLLIPAARRLVILADPDNMGTNLGTMGAFDIGGFLIGPLISGLLAELFGLRVPFLFFAVVTALFVPAVAKLPADRGEIGEERRVVRVLLRQPGIQTVLVSTVGWFAMIGVFESVWAVMLTDRGAETWLIAVTMSMIMLPMLFIAPFSGGWAQRFGPLKLIGAGILFVAPIFMSYGFLESLLAITLLATLQGVGDAVVFPGAQVGVAVAAPEGLAASAQGLQGATLELTAGSTALVAGAMYEAFGPKAVFLSCGTLMLAGVLVGALMSRSLERDNPLLVGQPEDVEVADPHRAVL